MTFDTRVDIERRMRYNRAMPQKYNPLRKSSNPFPEIARAAALSAALFAVGSFAAIGCAGDQDQGQAGASQEDAPAAGGNQSEDVIYGDACAERDDIYQVGLLHIADGKGGIDQEKFNDLANNVTIKDGRSGVKTPEITSIPEDVLNQIRTSVILIVNDGELVPAVVNLYGEPQSDWDDYDGVLNSGLKACV